MGKKVLLFNFVFFSLFTGIFAQSSKEAKFQLSLVPPIGTQGAKTKEYTNDFSLNILVGVSENERIFTLGGILNIIRNDASGFQLAGLGNVIGNNSKGFQIAGLFNMIGKDGQGLLLSNVFNYSKDYTGIQLAGIANIANDVSGLQLGVINKARNVDGVQFAGIMNIAENSDYPIGFINIIKNGEIGVGISYNETGTTMLSFRSGGRILYGIIGVGYNHRSDISGESFIVTGGLGAHINIKESLRINTEMKVSTYGTKNFGPFQHTIAILPAFRLGRNFEIFAGPTINYLKSDNEKNRDIFPDMSINIWKDFEGKMHRQVYVGFSIGTQVLF